MTHPHDLFFSRALAGPDHRLASHCFGLGACSPAAKTPPNGCCYISLLEFTDPHRAPQLKQDQVSSVGDLPSIASSTQLLFKCDMPVNNPRELPKQASHPQLFASRFQRITRGNPKLPNFPEICGLLLPPFSLAEGKPLHLRPGPGTKLRAPHSVEKGSWLESAWPRLAGLAGLTGPWVEGRNPLGT